MNESLISLEEFFNLRKQHPILDARSELEFDQSHIPSAINLPILNNEERKIIGTIYKNKGSEEAILAGFEIVGPRFHTIIKNAISLFPEKKIITYCWRGGMRSQIISWLLSMAGFKVYRLEGGYKTYRTFTSEQVQKPLNLTVLGGKTGSGKTLLLHHLQKKGEAILDLEKLANHKGSSFGGIGLGMQPTVEQFENLLAEEITILEGVDNIWVENESRKIGKVILPESFFHQLISAPMIEIERSTSERVKHITEEYAGLPKEELKKAVERIGKKLGGLRLKQALDAIDEGDHPSWIENMLIYYDKAYTFDIERHPREKIDIISMEDKSIQEACERLLNNKSKPHE
ncbi:MAG TPA: tRNA 2-selenouridine(34) synthase MnmH [Anditalea sp.]|nr:tRNA 2-selenouridine(34) synthase MnmH [Anditalea sp.]